MLNYRHVELSIELMPDISTQPILSRHQEEACREGRNKIKVYDIFGCVMQSVPYLYWAISIYDAAQTTIHKPPEPKVLLSNAKGTKKEILK